MAVTYIITGLLMGLVFGFALERGRAFEPGMRVGGSTPEKNERSYLKY